MNILVLGGSVFLGRAMVSEALALGADVTVFNRNRSGTTPEGARQLVGDRTVAADLEQLRAGEWDLVVDTCGYVPAEVTLTAELLADRAAHYAFVSSINAWPAWPTEPDHRARGEHDGQPDATRDDVPDTATGPDSYGWLKVGCERAVQRAFGPDRCSVLRAGAIVGPHDAAVGRLPWWLDRVSRGGDVLVPGRPDDPVALIDSRDLARLALRAVPGTVDVPGPPGRDTRADLMAACLAATGGSAHFTYADGEWLVEQGVGYWTELPLWIPESIGPGVFSTPPDDAVVAGLTWRPLAETVADTWAWQRDVPGGWTPPDGIGMAEQRERDLLAAWQARPGR